MNETVKRPDRGKRDGSGRPTGPADRELVGRLTAGDPTAWETFVDRFTPVIHEQIRHCLQRYKAWHSPHRDPGDLYLAVFQSFLENDCRTLRQFQGRCSLKRWVRMTTTSRVVDLLRKERNDLSLEAENEEGIRLMERIPDAAPDAEQLCFRRQRRDALRAALASWSAEDRLLLFLTYEQEMPADRIARVLNVSRESVYTRRHRLLQRLRKQLGAAFQGKI